MKRNCFLCVSGTASRNILLVLVFLCTVGTNILSAQPKLLRFEDDPPAIKDSINNLYRRIKFIPVDVIPNAYVSVGGELRAEYGGKVNEDWIANQGYNHTLLQRFSLHADFHAGTKIRLFLQLNSAVENGSKYGPAPVDEDQLNVQNFFADYLFLQHAGRSLTARIGRQEMNYGSGRIISVRDGTNTRQYFTGIKLKYASPTFSADAFVLAADKIKPGIFDNILYGTANLWGIYTTRKIQSAGSLDVYYLGSRKYGAVYEEGKANDMRHTLASRYWNNNGALTYNFEGAYQFGTFGKGNISAWTLAIEMGYRWRDSKKNPYIGLRNDYISGDKSAGDGSLQTFNPLYPKGGYFGFNPLIGPANLIDIHPYFTLSPKRWLSLQGDIVFNWRYSLNDGIYLPSGNLHYQASASQHRFIGTTYLLEIDFTISNYVFFSVGGQYFRVGNVIKDIIPDWGNSKYFNMQLSCKF